MDSNKSKDFDGKIGSKMAENKDFCLSIVNCKDRDEVKSFLKSNDIEASDADIDNLAKNISEIADICTKIDDKELEKIVGGAGDGNTSDVLTGIGIAGISLGGFGILTLIAAGIKKLGDKKGWWSKK